MNLPQPRREKEGSTESVEDLTTMNCSKQFRFCKYTDKKFTKHITLPSKEFVVVLKYVGREGNRPNNIDPRLPMPSLTKAHQAN